MRTTSDSAWSGAGSASATRRAGYGPSPWSRILRDQLDVDQETFWARVRDGTRPDRGLPPVPDHALPGDLVHPLLTRVGLTEAEVRRLTKPEAIARLQEHWTQGN